MIGRAPGPPVGPDTATLVAQIRPHFLFNVLTAIRACVRQQPALAEDLISCLADYVRTILSRRDGFVSVAEELRLVQTYLALERVRLGARLRTILDVDPASLTLRMPVLTLQPLVENAVVHAVSARAGGATLRIVVHCRSPARRKRVLVLMVADDGPGLNAPAWTIRETEPAWQPAREGLQLGLHNIAQRLHAIYGRHARLRLMQRPGGGVIAAVILPSSPMDEAGRLPIIDAAHSKEGNGSASFGGGR